MEGRCKAGRRIQREGPIDTKDLHGLSRILVLAQEIKRSWRWEDGGRREEAEM